jgi:hypothetical protein
VIKCVWAFVSYHLMVLSTFVLRTRRSAKTTHWCSIGTRHNNTYKSYIHRYMRKNAHESQHTTIPMFLHSCYDSTPMGRLNRSPRTGPPITPPAPTKNAWGYPPQSDIGRLIISGAHVEARPSHTCAFQRELTWASASTSANTSTSAGTGANNPPAPRDYYITTMHATCPHLGKNG